jgi:hypothetical protein
MIRKQLSVFVLFAFIHYIFAGCTSTREHKVLQEEFGENLWQETIKTVVLKDGKSYRFAKPGGKYKTDLRVITGKLRDGNTAAIDIDKEGVREIRISAPQVITMTEMAGKDIKELVLDDNLVSKSRDITWQYAKADNLLVGTRENGTTVKIEGERIKEIRIATGKTVTKEELLNNPQQPIYEVVEGANIYIFDQDRGFLKTGAPAIEGYTLSGAKINIPIENILYLKIERVDATATFFSILFGLVLVLGVLFVIALAAKQSCPFIYSFDGEKYIFDAEPLGGAVSRGLQKTDYSRLEHIKAVDNQYRFIVRNEVKETQYLDQMQLLVFDHQPDVTIMPTPDGHFYQIQKPVPCLRAIDKAGHNLIPFFKDNDGIIWQTPISQTTSTERHQLILEFPKPPNTNKANLIVNAGTALWGSNMIREMLQLRGDKVDDWYHGIDQHGPEFLELYHFIEREELYLLKIYLQENDQWVTQQYIPGGGPLVTEDRVIPLDLSNITGDKLMLALNPPPGFWQIDYIALDYEPMPVEPAIELPIKMALDQQENDISALLNQVDTIYHQMPLVGDWFKAAFEVPQISPGLQRSLFLKTNGYYEIHIDKTRPEKTALIRDIITTPGKIIDYSFERYAQWCQEQLSTR